MSPTAALKVNILLENKPEGGTIASLLENSSFRVEAATREQALQGLQKLLAERLQNTEVIPLQLELPDRKQAEASWLEFAGIFKGDPDFAEIAEAINAERQVEDETEVDPTLYRTQSTQP